MLCVSMERQHQVIHVIGVAVYKSPTNRRMTCDTQYKYSHCLTRLEKIYLHIDISLQAHQVEMEGAWHYSVHLIGISIFSCVGYPTNSTGSDIDQHVASVNKCCNPHH